MSSIIDRPETPVSFSRGEDTVQIQSDVLAQGQRTEQRAGSTPQVDSCILELKTLEQRDRFTVSSCSCVIKCKESLVLKNWTLLSSAVQNQSQQWRQFLGNLQTIQRLRSFEQKGMAFCKFV